jgi:hypothetical protein
VPAARREGGRINHWKRLSLTITAAWLTSGRVLFIRIEPRC